MKKNILITGAPKSGKSTLLNKVIESVKNKVGFVTNEILGGNGRVGFEIETQLGNKKTLAHIDFKTQLKVSKYSVDIENLDDLIPEVSNFQEGDLLYLDEIGQMELYSEKFKELTLSYLNSNNICIATLSEIYQDTFTDAIRVREDILLVELTPENRDEKMKSIQSLINNHATQTKN